MRYRWLSFYLLQKRQRRKGPKVKEEPTSIGPNGVRERLEGLHSFAVNLDLAIRSVTVDRKFMSATFGASPQALYSKSSRAGREYSFIFPNPKWNPEVPRIPGEAGLLCRAVDFVPWQDHVIKVLVWLDTNKWHYLGDYKSAQVRSLSQAEFLEFSSSVRGTLSSALQ